jgi:hypothetical protein
MYASVLHIGLSGFQILQTHTAGDSSNSSGCIFLGTRGPRDPSSEAFPHKESEFRACSGELGLHRAFSDSENIRGFANGEAFQFAQLKCSPQRRRELSHQLMNVLCKFGPATCLLWRLPTVRQPIAQRMTFLLWTLLV